jgi:hypothetical protein
MAEADLALLLLALAGAALRATGLLVAGRLPADHPLVRWAASVAVATLAAFIAAAVVAPGGALAAVPFVARLMGMAARNRERARGLMLQRRGTSQPAPAILQRNPP